MALDLSKQQIEEIVINNEKSRKYLTSLIIAQNVETFLGNAKSLFFSCRKLMEILRTSVGLVSFAKRSGLKPTY